MSSHQTAGPKDKPSSLPSAAADAKGKRKSTDNETDAEVALTVSKKVKTESTPAPVSVPEKKAKGKKSLRNDVEASAVSSSSSSLPGTTAAAAAASSGVRGPDKSIPGSSAYIIFEDHIVELGQTNIDHGKDNNKFYVMQVSGPASDQSARCPSTPRSLGCRFWRSGMTPTSARSGLGTGAKGLTASAP
jgi:hypothetical protein